MKFGKRRWESKLEKSTKVAAPPQGNPALESWTVPGDPEPAGPQSVAPPPAGESATVGDEPATVVDGDAVELPMTDVEPEAPEAIAEPEPEPEAEPVIPEPEPEPESESEPEPEPEPAPPAYDPQPYVSAPPVLSEPLPPPGGSWASPAPAPVPPPMPYPVAEEPVLVYTSDADSPAVTSLAEAGEAHASGHASGLSPSWPEPVMALAAERPEAVVGAAFAGGLLLAMILRRLGN